MYADRYGKRFRESCRASHSAVRLNVHHPNLPYVLLWDTVISEGVPDEEMGASVEGLFQVQESNVYWDPLLSVLLGGCAEQRWRL